MNRPSILVLIFCLLASSALAAPCYTAEQYRAEQAIRFHTKLMVLGLYCERALGPNTYAAYQKFTGRNGDIIRGQENILISYFKKTKAPNAEKALHSLRTNLANTTSLLASKSILSFCRTNKDDYQKARNMQPPEFRRRIDKVNVKSLYNTSTVPVCIAARQGK